MCSVFVCWARIRRSSLGSSKVRGRMGSLQLFLRKAHAAHDGSECRENYGWVLGNSSADLDSVVSAAVLAFLLTEVSGGARLYLPVVNIPEHHFVLRHDVIAFLCKVFGLAEPCLLKDLFLFRDSSRTATLFQTTVPAVLPAVALVDHTIEQSGSDYPFWFSRCVSSVVDHHGAADITEQSLERTIERWSGGQLHCVSSAAVGSCASLITLLLYTSEAGRRLQHLSPEISLDLRLALAGTIVKDTFGLNPEWEGKRWCHLDAEAFKLLTSYEDITLQDLTLFFDRLRSSQVAVLSNLDVQSLLFYDSKVFKYGSDVIVHYSSFPVSLKALFSGLRDRGIDVLQALDTFVRSHSVTFLVLMSLCFPENTKVPKRELALFFSLTASNDVEGEYIATALLAYRLLDQCLCVLLFLSLDTFSDRCLKRLRHIHDLNLEPLCFPCLQPCASKHYRVHLFSQVRLAVQPVATPSATTQLKELSKFLFCTL